MQACEKQERESEKFAWCGGEIPLMTKGGSLPACGGKAE